MRVAQDSGAKYTEKSIKAFLEGQTGCDEKWVMRVIGASSPDDLTRAMESLSYHEKNPRFLSLKGALGL